MQARNSLKKSERSSAGCTRKFVVPSAPGKRFSGDTKVTDMLYSCYGAAIREKKFAGVDFQEIRGRYQEIIDGLGLDFSLESEDFGKKSRENFGKKSEKDYAASEENI